MTEVIYQEAGLYDREYRLKKMKPDLKEDWLEALRSGEYEQGVHYLESEGTNCCLGVLCDIMDDVSLVNHPAGTSFRTKQPPQPTPFAPNLGDYSRDMHSVVNTVVKKKAGLNDDTCEILMALNDDGHTFEDIADFIEYYL